MKLEQASEENLSILINGIADRLVVVNRSIMQPEDYQIEKYDDIKFLYDHIESKGQLSVSETEAFIQELANYRK
ncbi:MULTISPECIES: DUF1128 domain-containing protein [Terribacillus]|jgi:uncharacterized protein YfkK (UPF0435 family)|uniref:DUF1128 domain-containing protein n=1 Tax=Terribacillus saccharophilus TaxID=361277 RepID=A0A1H8AWR4_9BACI|nr:MULTISPECIES: DUF1128 domain-containing protein [Terribacillus]AIF66346.1 hypothetical protein GZ22_06710 [Terribacillus goriensis]MCM3224955.1 DUF1128 domain-containing protein [Terribacillus saccharophilus]MEC0283125.1 DUF1128 domain-containing protein [Terribacillus saccharophilus]MEC0290082.1 DUF1128 domain-containing protein [Terribacillus saccharophilus]MEC0302982.1 DUF1128 domain-containing protein [Terribacillus saccharophilus]